MKVDSIAITPGDQALGMLLNFDNPSADDPYKVLDIEGLEAGDLMKSYYARGTATGKKFYNFTLPTREVTIKIGLDPRPELGESVSGLRDDIYRHISAARDGSVTMAFLTAGDVVAELHGTVSSVEPGLFEKRPTVDFRLECEDAILRSPARVDVPLPSGSATQINFDDPLSTAPHGLLFVVQFASEAKDLQIFDSSNDWRFTITPRDGFDPGDQIWANTSVEGRVLYRYRNGDWQSLGDVIAKNSVWPTVFPLANEFKFNRSVVLYLIGHYPAYWGV